MPRYSNIIRMYVLYIYYYYIIIIVVYIIN